MTALAILPAARTLPFRAAPVPCESGANPRPDRPYSPGRLVSLWDMLVFNANSTVSLKPSLVLQWR